MNRPEIAIVALQILILIGVAMLLARSRLFDRIFRKILEISRNLESDDYGYRHRYRYGLGTSYIQEIIRRAEDESNVRLTWGAREMLAIPVIEADEYRREVDWDTVDRSVRDIVHTMADDRTGDEVLEPRARSSLAAIRAFHIRFCNIPPFCSRTDRE